MRWFLLYFRIAISCLSWTISTFVKPFFKKTLLNFTDSFNVYAVFLLICWYIRVSLSRGGFVVVLIGFGLSLVTFTIESAPFDKMPNQLYLTKYFFKSCLSSSICKTTFAAFEIFFSLRRLWFVPNRFPLRLVYLLVFCSEALTFSFPKR